MFRLTAIAAVLIACLTFGCSRSPQANLKAPSPAVAPPSANADLKDARAHMLSHLKDPDSARFDGLKEVHLTSGGKGSTLDVVCGAVNAKNSMGGYTGFLPFAYVERVDDRAPTSNNLIEHFFQGRLILRDAGEDGPSGRWSEGDIDHLCGYETRFADDDDLLGTEMGRYEKSQQEEQQQMFANMRREEARRDGQSDQQMTSAASEEANTSSADTSNST